jgi:hypothetical protein
MSKPVYLHEADEYVGPFASREDAERFLILMEAHGVSSEGIEIVEVDAEADAVGGATSARERIQLLTKSCAKKATTDRRAPPPAKKRRG